MINFIDFI